MSEMSLPLSGPWFRIAANGAGATVTVGNPDSVTVSVDVDEGELAFLLPVVKDWLDAVAEDPFQHWKWDDKAGECRPMDLRAWDEERERLARMDIEVLCLEPWIMIFREDGRNILSIRTGLKDKRRIGITEAEAEGILLAIEAALPERWEPEYDDSAGHDGKQPGSQAKDAASRRELSILNLPLVDRLVLDVTPHGWVPDASHPASANSKLVRPWNMRTIEDRVSPNDIRRIGRNVQTFRRLILASLGIEGGDEPVLEGEGLAPPAGGRMSGFNNPSKWTVPWFDLGTVGGMRYRLHVTVFGDKAALMVSGNEPATAEDRARVETALKMGGFIRSDNGYVWARRNCEFNAEQRAHMLAGFNPVRKVSTVSEIIDHSDGKWPFPSDAADSFSFDLTVVDRSDGWERWLGAIETMVRKTEWETYAQMIDGETVVEVGGGVRRRRDLSSEEVMELIRGAALLHAADLKGMSRGQIIYVSKADDAKPSFYRQLDRIKRLVEAPTDEAAWKKALQDYEAPGSLMGELILRLMGAALFERRCLGVVSPQFVDNPYWSWTPFAEDWDGLQKSDVARAIEREVAEAVSSLGHAMEGEHAGFIDACGRHGEIWKEAIETAMAAIQEKSDVDAAVDEFWGGEKGRDTQDVAGRSVAALRLAWDCSWIWLEVAKKVARPSKDEAGKSARLEGNFNTFLNLVSHAVEDSEEVAERRARDRNIGQSHVSRTKRALQGYRLQEQWLIEPPPVIAGNPMNAVDGRFIAYAPQGVATAYGPAGWRIRERFTQSVTDKFQDVTDPEALKKKAWETGKRRKKREEA